MGTELIVFIILLLLLVLLELPISISIIFATIGFLLVSGQDLAIVAEQLLNSLFTNYLLLAVPLFILSANLMNASRVTDKLLDFCLALVGRFKGGLGHVNIVLSLIFSGMSGSAVADVAGVGKIIVPMMTKENKYSRGYAAAITAASSTIGPIVPPSIPMVLYALVSNASIGYLFLGGILPGIIMAIVLMMINASIARKKNFAVEKVAPLRELPKKTAVAFPSLMLPVILLYGIYGGVMTATEAAAIAALYALLIDIVIYRGLTFKKFVKAMSDTARASAAAGFIVGSSLIMNYVVVSQNIPGMLFGMFESIHIHPFLFMLMINVLVLALGCLLDASVIILVIIPLFLPTVENLGIDIVYFGVVIVINCMIGLITPPYGVIILVINSIMKIPLGEIVKEIWPFLLSLIGFLILLILFPDIVLFIPRLLGYQG